MKEIKLEQKQSRSGNRTGRYIGSIPNTPSHRKLLKILSKLLREYGKVQIEGRHNDRNRLAQLLLDSNHISCFVRRYENGQWILEKKLTYNQRRNGLISHVPVDYAQSFDVYLLKTGRWTYPLEGIPKYWNWTLEQAETYVSTVEKLKKMSSNLMRLAK